MAEFDLGDKVLYERDGKWLKGKVHAVKNVDGKRGPKIQSYLIDNGETHLEDEILTEGDEPNIKVSQPIQVEVEPDKVKAVK